MEDTPGWERHKPTRTGPFLFELPAVETKPRKPLRTRLILIWMRNVYGPIYFLSCTPRTLYHGFKLLWPVPWHFPVPKQRSVEELRGNIALLHHRIKHDVNYTPLRKIARFRARDTPLRCVYRLFEAVCVMSRNGLMEESQYFFHQQPNWKLKDIPDPKDPDPLRQAVLASLVETLVQSFNFKIGMGLRRGITMDRSYLIERFARETNPPYEEVPVWTSLVEPLPELLTMAPDMPQTNYKYFAKRNISVKVDSLWNI